FPDAEPAPVRGGGVPAEMLDQHRPFLERKRTPIRSVPALVPARGWSAHRPVDHVELHLGMDDPAVVPGDSGPASAPIPVLDRVEETAVGAITGRDDGADALKGGAQPRLDPGRRTYVGQPGNRSGRRHVADNARPESSMRAT